MTAPGRFISLEGGEGVGKSTQVRALADALRQRGIDILVTREPGGSEGAEKIRDLLLSGLGNTTILSVLSASRRCARSTPSASVTISRTER